VTQHPFPNDPFQNRPHHWTPAPPPPGPPGWGAVIRRAVVVISLILLALGAIWLAIDLVIAAVALAREAMDTRGYRRGFSDAPPIVRLAALAMLLITVVALAKLLLRGERGGRVPDEKTTPQSTRSWRHPSGRSPGLGYRVPDDQQPR